MTHSVATVPHGHFGWQKLYECTGMAVYTVTSIYFITLSVDDQRHYRRKLELLGNVEDPYLMWEKPAQTTVNTSLDWLEWPNVEYPDIYNYLIETPSLCTKESLKTYKSLDGYKYYCDG